MAAQVSAKHSQLQIFLTPSPQVVSLRLQSPPNLFSKSHISASSPHLNQKTHIRGWGHTGLWHGALTLSCPATGTLLPIAPPRTPSVPGDLPTNMGASQMYKSSFSFSYPQLGCKFCLTSSPLSPFPFIIFYLIAGGSFLSFLVSEIPVSV